MAVPGFTAEASFYKTGAHYQMTGALEQDGGTVRPAQIPAPDSPIPPIPDGPIPPIPIPLPRRCFRVCYPVCERICLPGPIPRCFTFCYRVCRWICV